MKKLILCLVAISAIAMTSCGDADNKDSGAESNKDPLDQMCECATIMNGLREEMMIAEGNEVVAIEKEMAELNATCKEVSDSIEKGKTKDEIKKIKMEFKENCEAFK
jgi:hypothetical protein